MEPLHTLSEVVQHIDDNYSISDAFNYFDDGHWRSISTESFIFDIKRLTYGLIALGLRRGDKVGILADSSPYWCIADFAVILAGGVTIPLFSKISHENFIYECAQANIRFLFVQGEEHWAMYNEHRSLFELVISLDETKMAKEATTFHEILQLGEKLWEEKPKLWDELLHQINSDDICTIIYTAGSTGMPKGVQLTHKNLCHLVSFEVFGWNLEHDKYLSILPLAHVFARQINMILVAWGVRIYYLNDLTKLGEVSKKLQPSLMIVVPRVLEKMYSALAGSIKHRKDGIQSFIAKWAFDLANDMEETTIKKYILRPLADLLVYRQIRKELGEKWRVILSGGAALDPKLCQFFINLGIPVYEGWGLTEGSTACVNLPNQQKVGTVGRPLPGVKITLGENDEVLIGGPTVMKGYYRHPEATKMAIDDEGWLHTGDKGVIDSDGYLKIVGRVKEQFKLSTGEYLSPSRIEHMLQQHPLVDLAMVVGERMKFAACLLFPDKGFLNRMKKELNMESLSDEEFLQTPAVQKEMDGLLDAVNRKINAWEKLYKYRFILETPTIEAGELTPTLKLKRNVIIEKYQNVIDSIYV